MNIGFDYMPALESIGTYTYLQHIFVSEPEPDAGLTQVELRLQTTSKADPLATLLSPICRFGNVPVVGSFSDIGGVVACITPAASSSSVSFSMSDNKGLRASGSIFTDHRSRNYHYDYFHDRVSGAEGGSLQRKVITFRALKLVSRARSIALQMA